ncbi:unnamed protein product, partial [Amoebophrya sp. A120]
HIRTFIGTFPKLGITNWAEEKNVFMTPELKNQLPENHFSKQRKLLCRDPADINYCAVADLFYLVAERLP